MGLGEDRLSSNKGLRRKRELTRRILELLNLRAAGRPIIIPPKKPRGRDKGDRL